MFLLLPTHCVHAPSGLDQPARGHPSTGLRPPSLLISNSIIWPVLKRACVQLTPATSGLPKKTWSSTSRSNTHLQLQSERGPTICNSPSSSARHRLHGQCMPKRCEPSWERCKLVGRSSSWPRLPSKACWFKSRGPLENPCQRTPRATSCEWLISSSARRSWSNQSLSSLEQRSQYRLLRQPSSRCCKLVREFPKHAEFSLCLRSGESGRCIVQITQQR